MANREKAQNEPELTSVRELHRFDEAALATCLEQAMESDFSDLSVRQYEGGQSNPTFLLTSKSGLYVMRKKPPGKLLKSAHAVEREYRVMTALRDSGVPVPKTYLLCEDDSVLGTPFFVMEAVQGRVMVDALLPGLSNQERAGIYDDFIRLLVEIHRVDLGAVGLTDFGRPGNYFSRQISRWTKQYLASETETIDAMNTLIEWLPKNVPEGGDVALVHGDYRIGNCIIHPTEPRIVSILDWELSTTGHPLGDLAYACMAYHRDDTKDFDFEGAGIPSERQFVDRYCELMGRDAPENWKFYVVYNLFRSAANTQGVYKRGVDGNASSDHWPRRIEQTRLAAERALALISD